MVNASLIMQLRMQCIPGGFVLIFPLVVLYQRIVGRWLRSAAKHLSLLVFCLFSGWNLGLAFALAQSVAGSARSTRSGRCPISAMQRSVLALREAPIADDLAELHSCRTL